jgi:3-methyladenine DNA glycosylase Tag
MRKNTAAKTSSGNSVEISFVGTTICYAFMQAVGMVNDHLTTCFRYGAI